MPLTALSVEDFRCLHHAELELAPGLNLIHGPNGAGKTSLLEAMFLLGRGRSFRTRNSERLIRQDASLLRIVGRARASPDGIMHVVGVQVSREGGMQAKVDGAFLESLAQLAPIVPVQVIDPEVHRLIEDGPQRRRRWLDWLVFHVEPSFVDHWMRYTRAIRQRNAALKAEPSAAAAWDLEVVRHGEAITIARRNAMEALLPRWRAAMEGLGGPDASLSFHQGWAQDTDFADALQAARDRDHAHHTTSVGPHRADVTIRARGRAAREMLSRGQQKVVAVAMVLSQIELLEADLGIVPSLLLDDPSAELDPQHLAAFMERVQALRCQLVVTSIQKEFSLLGFPERVFHVEQGRVAQL